MGNLWVTKIAENLDLAKIMGGVNKPSPYCDYSKIYKYINEKIPIYTVMVG